MTSHFTPVLKGWYTHNTKEFSLLLENITYYITCLCDICDFDMILRQQPFLFTGICLFLSPATKLGQGYVFTGVCYSVNRGGTSPPLRADTPQSRHPPPASMVWDTVDARAVRILLECNLVVCLFTLCCLVGKILLRFQCRSSAIPR